MLKGTACWRLGSYPLGLSHIYIIIILFRLGSLKGVRLYIVSSPSSTSLLIALMPRLALRQSPTPRRIIVQVYVREQSRNFSDGRSSWSTSKLIRSLAWGHEPLTHPRDPLPLTSAHPPALPISHSLNYTGGRLSKTGPWWLPQGFAHPLICTQCALHQVPSAH